MSVEPGSSHPPPMIYRSMLPDGERPMVGPNKKMLGAKIGAEEHDDLAHDNDGQVSPGQGGMSVVRNWRDLPTHRIPKRLNRKWPAARGHNALQCWRLGTGEFADGPITPQLDLRVDRPPHGLIEPAQKMLAERYQAAIAATRDRWVIDEE